MIRGSIKPNVYTARDRADMEDIYYIACAVAGGEAELREKTFLMLYAESISPLLHHEDSVDKLLLCAEKGFPVTYPPSPNTPLCKLSPLAAGLCILPAARRWAEGRSRCGCPTAPLRYLTGLEKCGI
jgi:hypothetical protein